MMNNIEILEKLKDEQYTKETVNTLYEFYDEEFKPYVLSTEERDALENLIQENKELKEENKIAKKMGAEIMADFIKRDVIPKSKLKEIIYPTPENPIPLELQSSEMYKKLEKLVEGE